MTNKDHLIFRKATSQDLPDIIHLLLDDKLGQTREMQSPETYSLYEKAFQTMTANPMHAFMVTAENQTIIGCCQLTLLHGLSFQGITRLNIESVRVASTHRNQGIGSWMMTKVVEFAKENEVGLIQLTTHKERPEAKRFYEKLGFVASHEGMKKRVSWGIV